MSYKVHARVPSDGELDALAGVPAADGSNPLVTLHDRRLVANGGVAGAIASASVFGSGRDGNLVFNGSAVTGFTLTGTAYVRNLKYDLHARSITVSDGYSIDMVGTRLRAFVGTLGNDVRIHNDASYCDIYASTNYAIASTALPCENINTSTGAIFHGGNGGQLPNIPTTDNNAGAGSSRSGSVRGLMVGGGSYPGGRISQVAGLAAAAVNPTVTYRMTGLSSHCYGDLFEMVLGPFPYARNGSSILALSGGMGGGRGYYGTTSGDSTASPSGAGGGGVIGIAIKDLSCGSGCIFSANGGSCADAFSTSISAASPAMIGGASGGGGGAIAVLIGQITGDYLPTIEAKGGNGGAGAFTLGTVTNTDTYLSDGGSGGDGGKAMLYIGFNLVGGTPTIDVSGGVKGTSQAGATPTYSSINVDGSAGIYHYYQAA